MDRYIKQNADFVVTGRWPKIALATAILLLPWPVLALTVDTGLGFNIGFGWPDRGFGYVAVGILRLLMGVAVIGLICQVIKAHFIIQTQGGNATVREQAMGMVKDSFIGIILVIISAAAVPSLVNFIMRATGMA